MNTQSVILELPDELYNRYKQRAAQTHRSIEAELVEVVAKAAPIQETSTTPLSDPDLLNLVAQLPFLDNEALRRIAQRALPKKDTARTEALHFKRQNDGLDATEAAELATLMRKFERWFVLRNEALDILLKRGETASKQSRK